MLVHRVEDGTSFIVPADAGEISLKSGSIVSNKPEVSLLGAGFHLRVARIDRAADTATIEVSRTQPQLPQQWPPSGPFQTPWVKWADLIGGRTAADNPAGLVNA
ncbi:hypothetical protein [Falsiroseomonas sp. HW251]|uniref:hypothetical protein n=1 Tax=Falsiroseomonas sp. HW251 TaxID=3390998 RepID=UPI003D322790